MPTKNYWYLLLITTFNFPFVAFALPHVPACIQIVLVAAVVAADADTDAGVCVGAVSAHRISYVIACHNI